MADDNTLNGQFGSEIGGGGGASRILPLGGALLSLPTNTKAVAFKQVVPADTQIDIISGVATTLGPGDVSVQLTDSTDAGPGPSNVGENLYSISSSGVVAGKPLSSVTFSENRELSIAYENKSDQNSARITGTVVIALGSDNEDDSIVPPVETT